jgi:hypothetical protein
LRRVQQADRRRRSELDLQGLQAAGQRDSANPKGPVGGWLDPEQLDHGPDVRRLAQVGGDIEDVLSRRAHGAELVSEVQQYDDSYRLCYVRGPEGIIVELAEKIS